MRWPGRIPAGTVSDALVSGIDFAPTVMDILGLPPILGVDGTSMKRVILEGAEHHEDIFTLFFKTNNNHVTHRALHYPMRCVQNKRFAYIFNAWSDGKCTFLNESTEGLTFKAMERAAETDGYIRSRVEFFQHRVTEELYDYVNDPHAKNNLIDRAEYGELVNRLRRRMFAYMVQSQDGLQDDFYRRVICPNGLGDVERVK